MYKQLKDNTASFGVKQMCEAFMIPRCSYYAWQKRGISKRKREDMYYTELIATIHEQKKHRYGSPRITAELQAEGIKIGEKRVCRLMRIQGFTADRRKKRRRSYYPGLREPAAGNMVNRKFNQRYANNLWAGDISEIQTNEGVMYLSVVMDMWSRAVIGWDIKSSMDENLVIRALEKAIISRKPKGKLIVHTDRGSQYSGVRYRQLLKKNNITQSMSFKGNCYDNAPVESFFASLKKELVYRDRFKTKEEARRKIFEYIEIFYNRQRRHSSLGYLSPMQFEKLKNNYFLSV